MLEHRINIDPEISHGRPVIKGTRVPVEIVLGYLAGGMEINEVALEYGLQRENVLAAIEYTARIVASEEILSAHCSILSASRLEACLQDGCETS
jgi:uncharacterized protein (DUF433 family)